VQIGFNAWLKWYKLSRTATTKKLTYEKFMRSKYYLAFTKFGKHVLEVKLLNPEQFIVFVIKNHIKLDDWTKDSVYEFYINDVCKREDVETALKRQVQLMVDWARDNNEDWTNFFEKIHPNIALNLIRTGRISPWIILNSLTIYKLFNRMSEEQIQLVNKFINIPSWKALMLRNKKDAEFVNKILEEYGI